jgi:hypothetical protein
MTTSSPLLTAAIHVNSLLSETIIVYSQSTGAMRSVREEKTCPISETK